MPLFDLVMMVDWSGASTRGPARPTADRCWIGWGRPGGAPVQAEYSPTRHEAEQRIAELIGGCSGPVLVGFDFPFGYPAGSGLGGGRSLAARLAAIIEDAPDGTNNRFAVAAGLNAELNPGGAGPFWGCPAAAERKGLPARKSWRTGRVFPDSRHADARLLSRGIQSCWKLYTRGSVGSQVLMGMPAVHRLLTHPRFGERCRVWPFETQWDECLDGVVITEIWPSLIDCAQVAHDIKDARQVTATCEWALAADEAGSLRQAFARPPDLGPEPARVCLAEEGWILGLGTGLA